MFQSNIWYKGQPTKIKKKRDSVINGEGEELPDFQNQHIISFKCLVFINNDYVTKDTKYFPFKGKQ